MILITHNFSTRKSIIQKVLCRFLKLHMLYYFRFQNLFHCAVGTLFNFHLRYWFTIALLQYLALVVGSTIFKPIGSTHLLIYNF